MCVCVCVCVCVVTMLRVGKRRNCSKIAVCIYGNCAKGWETEEL